MKATGALRPPTTRAEARAETVVRAVLLVVLYSVPAMVWMRDAIRDPDIWWHLRTGQWILEHHAVPAVDPFSSATLGHAWAAYSWLFEVLVFQLFSRFGLLSFPIFTSVLIVLITAALHRLILSVQGDFSISVLLTFAGVLAISHLYTPRPWLFTIHFFIVELTLLLQARSARDARALLWLPILFALWANLHIQFVDGLIVLALAALESIALALSPALAPNLPTNLKPWTICGTFVACIAAACVNPYGWRIYPIAYALATQKGVLNLIGELKAVPFRDLTDFMLLILTLAACATLARARSLPWFETALFAFAAYVSFHSQRDVWVMAVVAVQIIGSGPGIRAPRQLPLPPAIPVLAAAAAVGAVLVSFRFMNLSNSTLATQLATTMPVDAVEFIEAHHLPGPLYNDFNWGGYLMWSLRLPVSIDGRAALHGDQRIAREVGTIGGQPGWATDPQLQSAKVILLPIDSPLAQLLQLDPRFHLSYQDKVAAVFTPSAIN